MTGPQQPSVNTPAPTVEGLPQDCASEVERWQLLQETEAPLALQTALPVAPSSSGDVSVKAVGNSQFSASAAGRSTPVRSTNTPKSPGSRPKASENCRTPNQSNLTDYVTTTCYSFLDTGFTSSIPVENFEYLDHIGCLQLPQRRLLDELVRAYFLYVHPHLPVIDEDKFWEIYLSNQPVVHDSSRMSLFVFHTMLLVACSFVSSSTIQDLGFRSVRAARATQYRRAKALFDFDIERNHLAKAQGALLMTYHVPLNEPLINSYWLGVAIHFARAEGAERYSTYTTADPARHNQLKRLWWCCIIRDRLLALGLRRPISIFSQSIDELWPPLTEDDLKNEIGRSCVCSAPVKTRLLGSLAALCKLCGILTDILPLLYPPDGVHASGDRLDLLNRLYTHTHDLNEWHDAVANNEASYVHGQHENAFHVVVLFTNLLTIYFQSAKAALCNYRIMLTVDRPVHCSFERLQVKNELQAILRGIAQSLRAIINAEMIAYSPVSMVAFLALPSVCYNLDLSKRSAPGQDRTNSPGSNIYRDFLRVLQLRYEGTDRALGNMSRLMNNMDLEDATSPSTARSGSEDRPFRHQELRRSSDIQHSPKSGSGIDIVVTDPRKYIQMSYTLDFFLSRGRFPTKSEYPPMLLSTFDEARAGPGPDSASDAVSPDYMSNNGTSSFPNQAANVKPSWEASSIGSIDLTAADGHRTDNSELSAMFTHDALGQTSTHADLLSFENFMTDGPFSGIEQLENMLYAYPG